MGGAGGVGGGGGGREEGKEGGGREMASHQDFLGLPLLFLSGGTPERSERMVSLSDRTEKREI